MDEGREASSRYGWRNWIGGPAESVAALAAAVGGGISLGGLSDFPKLWGFQVWQYLPLPATVAATSLALIVCLRPARDHLLAGAARLEERGSRVPRWSVALLVPTLAVVLFSLRERRLYAGDAVLLLFSAQHYAFSFPDLGATWLFHILAEAARVTGLPGAPVAQAGTALAGSAAVLCTLNLARILAPDRCRAVGFVAIVFGGGLLRVIAGHVEVYAFALFAAAAYLWSGSAFLAGRAPLWTPALAYGVGLWVHPSFAFLLPSLALLAGIESRRTVRWLEPWVGTACVSAVPLVLFLALAWAFGAPEQLREVWNSAAAIVTTGKGEGGYWLKLPLSSPGPGTEWTILSLPHVRFLANSIYLLAPCALPLLVGMSLAPRGPDPVPHATRFLATATLGGGVYALLLRPFWGPYDWDLFSLSALCMAVLAAHLWIRSAAPWSRSVGLIAIAAGWLLVAIPSVAIGIRSAHEAGPLVHTFIPEPGEDFWETMRQKIEPWL